MAIPFRIREISVRSGKAWVPDHAEIEHLAQFAENPAPPLDQIRLSLFAVVDTHHPGEYSLERSLEDGKQQLFAAVDVRTAAIIRDGFVFEDIRFSASLEAQAQYNGMVTAATAMGYSTFPIAINSLDDVDVLNLTSVEHLLQFAGACLSHVRAAVDGGSVQKDLIRSMETVEELDAYVDPR